MIKEKPLKNTVFDCEIEWNHLTVEAWESRFKTIKRSNLLQSFAYGRAMAILNHQSLRQGVIKINGQEAGLVQVLEAGILWDAVQGVLLDRGPLWFKGFGGILDFEAFLKAFSKEYPKRFGRRIRFIPEVKQSTAAVQVMKDYGYRVASQRGYQTIWLDLSRDLEVLRQNLKSKWRNVLKKAEKQNLEVIWSDKGEHFAWLINHYAADKAVRGYDGPSPKTISILAKEFSRGQNMLIGTALLDGEPIAAILLFNHGSSATYQIGFTSDIGREKCAHHLLLWRAIIELKERDINDFDLGGINEETAKGVKLFKEGLGGKIYETLGLYH